MRVLVTGANGFVGRPVCHALRASGHAVRAALRRHPARQLPDVEHCFVGDVGPGTVWDTALDGCEVVVHLAAHTGGGRIAPADAFDRVNVAGTACLARAAVSAGVRRLVYMSSVKVHGESSSALESIRATDSPAPSGAYARSKWAAEEALRHTSAATGLELVVLRAPLVHGPGVRGNLRRLVRWVARGLPLPLGAVQNRRSLVAVDDLSDLVERCTWHPSAAGRPWLASGGEDLSTPELVRALAAGLGRRARLLPVAPWLLLLAGRGLGMGEALRRLTESLVVDGAPLWETLGWRPRRGNRGGLVEVGRSYRTTRQDGP